MMDTYAKTCQHQWLFVQRDERNRTVDMVCKFCFSESSVPVKDLIYGEIVEDDIQKWEWI